MNDDSNHFGRKVAKLQVRFPNLKITRDILANIESRRCVASHHHVLAFSVVLGVEIGELFRP